MIVFSKPVISKPLRLKKNLFYRSISIFFTVLKCLAWIVLIFYIMQEYKRKTNSGKTTQDVIDRASAAVAGGQCSRGKLIFVQYTKNGATFKTPVNTLCCLSGLEETH